MKLLCIENRIYLGSNKFGGGVHSELTLFKRYERLGTSSRMGKTYYYIIDDKEFRHLFLTERFIALPDLKIRIL